MVTITKRQVPEGWYYEIDDFDSYVRALQQRGIEAPRARYRVFISRETEQDLRRAVGNLEDQVKLFFRLSPATEIESEVVEA